MRVSFMHTRCSLECDSDYKAFIAASKVSLVIFQVKLTYRPVIDNVLDDSRVQSVPLQKRRY